MGYVVFDFEAVRDETVPFEPRAQVERITQDREHTYELKHVPVDAFPPVCHFKIVCGAAIFLGKPSGQDPIARASLLTGSEPEIIEHFVRIVNKSHTLVTFNGRGFDVPLPAQRAMRYGIDVSPLYDRDLSDRYRGHRHLDLVEHLTNYGATQKPRMVSMARLVGWPGKLDVDGSQVTDLVEQGRLREVERYCMQDVANEAAIMLRLELCRGYITREQYGEYAAALLDLVDREPDLEPMRQLIDRDLFLYCHEPGKTPPVPRGERRAEDDQDSSAPCGMIYIEPSGSPEADLALRNRITDLLWELGVDADGGFDVHTGKGCVFCYPMRRGQGEGRHVADAVKKVITDLEISSLCTYRGRGDEAAGGAAPSEAATLVDELNARWRAEGLTEEEIGERLTFECARNCYKSDTGINPPNWTIEEARKYLATRIAPPEQPEEDPASAEECEDCRGVEFHTVDCASSRPWTTALDGEECDDECDS